MKQIEFSQQELQILLGALNHAFKMGNLSLGDALAITPIAQKLQSNVIPPSDENQTVAEEPLKSN